MHRSAMTNIWKSFAALAGLLVCSLSTAAAPAPVIAAEFEAKATKPDPVVEQADAILLARQLAKYGRAHKIPEALVVAAQILATTPTRTRQQLQLDEKAAPSVPVAPAVEPKKPIDVPTLLAEARAMAPDNKQLLAMIDRVPTKRGNVEGGSLVIATTIKPRSEKTTTIEFRGGEDAYIGVSGDGSGDLDCWVIDAKGKVVVSAVDAKDDCRLHWVPKLTEKFKLRIKNSSDVTADLTIFTN
jgi:hypothetical protein